MQTTDTRWLYPWDGAETMDDDTIVMALTFASPGSPALGWKVLPKRYADLAEYDFYTHFPGPQPTAVNGTHITFAS